MSALAMGVCLGALGLIALLPRVFFRRGRLNARWWLTAAPFAVAGATLVAGLAGYLDALVDGAMRELLAWSALAAAGAGVALMRWTLHTHARPVSLWHQEDDRPDELVMRGAYAHVRHPFYASFLLVLAGCALAFPHVATGAALVAAFVLLNRTAAREERRLVEAFGNHYMRYMKRSGRFVPRGITSVAEGQRNALRPPMLVLALLLAATAPVEAQRNPDRFRRVAVETPASVPIHPGSTREARASAGPVGSGALSGALIGGGVGLAAAIPTFVHTLHTCGECMFMGLEFPVFAVAGMLVGTAAGGAVGAAYETPRGPSGLRSGPEDVRTGAMYGVVASLVGMAIVTAVFVPRWEVDPYDDMSGHEDALAIGAIVPLGTVLGAAAGAFIDARGGDVPWIDVIGDW